MTAGAYGAVIFADASNGAAMTTWALGIGSQGNMRRQMMRAFSSDETDKILAKLPWRKSLKGSGLTESAAKVKTVLFGCNPGG